MSINLCLYEKTEYASTVFLRWFSEKDNNLKYSLGSGYLPVKKDLNTEEAAKETVKLNMPIADKFYAIYNRCSLPVDNSASVTDDNGFCYSPVESVYDTLASLKADTEKYFTKEYLDSTFYKNLADETAFYKEAVQKHRRCFRRKEYMGYYSLRHFRYYRYRLYRNSALSRLVRGSPQCKD